MKELLIIVKPFRAQAVMQAIAELDVVACVVREAKGYGRQKDYLTQYSGSEYNLAFLPKVEISVWVTDDNVEAAKDHIVKAARTGRIGDGKILQLDGAWPEPLEF
jgi:nitrogen regulatory protein PII